jgi:hypothetical protein
VFLTAVIFLAMEQRVNNKFCFKLGKTPTEIYEILQTVCGDEGLICLNGLNDLKTGMRIFRMIQDGDVLQPLEMHTQSQIWVKWLHENVGGLSG